MARLSFLLTLSFMAVCFPRDVPDNLKKLYQELRGKDDCSNKLATGFMSSYPGSSDFSYCADHLSSDKIIYLQGRSGALANMDIDCDGVQGSPADDGRCGSSRDTQPATAFRDVVASYGHGLIRDLDANAQPYVVLGNDGSKPGWRTFDPRSVGVEPLSVVAVVCGDRLVYGVWGDTNGDDGPAPLVGEASIALATACFGKGMNGNNGHDVDDVLYVAFVGVEAVPGAKGANWSAGSFEAFESSISAMGDELVRRIGNNSSSGGSGSNGGNGSGGGSGGGTDLRVYSGFLVAASLLVSIMLI